MNINNWYIELLNYNEYFYSNNDLELLIYPKTIGPSYIDFTIIIAEIDYYSTSNYYFSSWKYNQNSQSCNLRDMNNANNFTYFEFGEIQILENGDEIRIYDGRSINLSSTTSYCLGVREIDNNGYQYSYIRYVPINTTLSIEAITGISIGVIISSILFYKLLEIPLKKLWNKFINNEKSKFIDKWVKDRLPTPYTKKQKEQLNRHARDEWDAIEDAKELKEKESNNV